MKLSLKSCVKIKTHVVDDDHYKNILTELAEVIYGSIYLSKQSNSIVTECKGSKPFLLTPINGANCGKI